MKRWPRGNSQAMFQHLPLSPAVGRVSDNSPILDRTQGITVNRDKLTAHLEIERYGDFWLTDAIRPSPKRQIVPSEGYRRENYLDARNGLRVPVLAAALSREKLFDVFLEMLD